MHCEGAPAKADWVGPPGAAYCQEADLPWQEQDAGKMISLFYVEVFNEDKDKYPNN